MKTLALTLLCVALAGCSQEPKSEHHAAQARAEMNLLLDRSLNAAGRYQFIERQKGSVLLDTATGRMWFFMPATNIWGGVWVLCPDVAATPPLNQSGLYEQFQDWKKSH